MGIDGRDDDVPGSQFVTTSSGRGVCPVELEIGLQYTLQETAVPVQNVQLTNTPFVMEKRNQQLRITNHVTQPNTPYSG